MVAQTTVNGAFRLFMETLALTCTNCRIVVFSPRTIEWPGIVNVVSAPPGHIQHVRYGLYASYLARHANTTFDAIVVCDTDVVFQQDVPSMPPGALNVSWETTAYSIATEPSGANAAWVRHLYGEQEIARLGPLRVSCSGFTIGGDRRMRAYTRSMADEVQTRVAAHQVELRSHISYNLYRGLDQGVHNALLHEGRLNRTAPAHVLTTGGVRLGRDFTIAGDSVRDLQGRPFLAVHQWTRSELLKRMYAARSN